MKRTTRHKETEFLSGLNPELFQTLIEVIPNPVHYKSLDGRYLACNTLFAEYIGRDKKTILGKTVYEVMDDREAEIQWLADQELLKSRIRQQYRTMLLHADGSLRDVVMSNALHETHGEPCGILGIIMEINLCPAKGLCHEEVCQSNRFLSTIIANIPHAVFIKDTTNMKFVLVNKASETLFGTPARNLIGKTVYDVLSAEEAAVFSGQDWQMGYMLKAGPLSGPVRTVQLGDRRHDIKKVPIFSAEGRPEYLLGIAEDVTERELYEKQLQESELLYRTVMNQSSDGIFTFDPRTGRIQLVNEQLSKLTGLDQAALLTMTLPQLAGYDAEMIVRQTMNPQRSGREFFGAMDFNKADGSNVPVEVSASRVEWGGGQMVIVNVRDVTERLTQEQEIRRDAALANRVQRRLLPPDFSKNGLTVKTVYDPLQVVSGDFYDYRWSEDRRTFFGYVADAMGHGLSTALMTTAISVLLRESVKQKQFSLYERVSWVNNESLHYLADHSFVAMAAFEIDRRRRRITIVCCGINKFIANNCLFQGLVKLPGSFLGVHKDLGSTEITMSYQPGDFFCFMSDGLYDLFDEQEALTVSDFDQMQQLLRSKLQLERHGDDAAALCLHLGDTSRSGEPEAKLIPPMFLRLRFQGYLGVALIWPLVSRFIRQSQGRAGASLFEIGVLEAVNNAVKHSSGNDLDTMVAVTLHCVAERWLVVRVKDQGPGFPGNDKLDILRKKEQLFDDDYYAVGGRGLPFMVSACDMLKFNGKGNEVLLAKKL
ncbi:MAG TPA: PAS domain S-box protein [Patescibacteria group bacterium]|nr:PAS domain S-box protein [Patescibacteria group bacterium]